MSHSRFIWGHSSKKSGDIHNSNKRKQPSSFHDTALSTKSTSRLHAAAGNLISHLFGSEYLSKKPRRMSEVGNTKNFDLSSLERSLEHTPSSSAAKLSYSSNTQQPEQYDGLSTMTPSQRRHVVSNSSTPLVGPTGTSHSPAATKKSPGPLSSNVPVVTPMRKKASTDVASPTIKANCDMTVCSTPNVSESFADNLKYHELLLARGVIEGPFTPDKMFSSYFKQRLSALSEGEESRKKEDAKTLERVAKRMERERIEELIAPRKAPISDEDQDKISRILRGPSSHEVLVEKFNIDMTRAKILCLRPGTWLNDEVVNYYMAMLLDRDSRLVEESKSQANGGKGTVRKPSYFFNSFFMSKLLENGHYDYAKVKRWTKKFDVFEQDKIFFPVNLSNTHWTMAVVYVQKKEIHYYDSMNGSGKRQLDALLSWIVDEAKEKKKMTLDPKEWNLLGGSELGTPQQENGFDCGMFSIYCANYLADDLPLEYSQNEMRDNRLKVGAAILNGTLPY